jgi:tRNA(Ile)-lysidine synthase
MSLTTRTVEYLRKMDVLHPGGSFVLAVSGGMDSVVMASIFGELAARWQLDVHCAYIHHGLRPEANQEQEFVQTLALQLHMDFHAEALDLASVPHSGASLQLVARIHRYNALEDIRQRVNARWICTAHHADDQAETLLGNFLSGKGFRSLIGIRPMQGNILRPLLFAEQREIAAYASDRSLRWCEDSSNATDKYRRNAIRHHVVPAVRQHVNPSLAKTLAGTANMFSMLDEYLTHRLASLHKECVTVAEHGVFLAVHALNRYFEIERMLITWDVLTNLENSLSAYDAVESVLSLRTKQTGSSVDIGSGYTAYREHESIWISNSDPSASDPVTVEPGMAIATQLGVFSAERIAPDDIVFSDDSSVEFIDSGKAGASWILRPWKPGDAFIPLGMKALVDVSKYLTSQNIASRRKQAILVLEANGSIIWICGMRLDDRFKVTKETREIIRLRFQKPGECMNDAIV